MTNPTSTDSMESALTNDSIESDTQTATIAKKNLQKWLAESSFDWQESNLKDNFYQAMIDIGNDIELCVEVGGNPKDPALLLIMGLGSQMIFWPNNFLDALVKKGFFVIRFDNRDIGLSTKIRKRGLKRPPVLEMMGRMQVGLSNKHIPVAYNLEAMTEDTYNLIESLELENINVMGASMGGIIAQILAAKYPEHVNKLILMFSTTNRPMLRIPKPKQMKALFASPKSMALNDVLEHSLNFMNAVGSPGHIDEAQVKEIATIRYHRNSSQMGTNHQFHAILSTGSIKKYSKNISADTLIMHGSEDGLIPYQNGRDISRIIPSAKFELIKGMGHDIPNYYQVHIINQITKHCLG